MAATRHCAECGTPVPDEAPNGSCPVCALRGALEISDETSIVVVTERAGDQIGRYRLLEKIGEGGCGIVYLADQTEPIRRRVALKIVKLGMDTKEVIARFEAERQALALMDHPNIARVFDAGATAAGRPYFVMELVQGTAITDYCNARRVPVRERLALFTAVCGAVQHAHQKGIIHRDLKPSNVMVTMQADIAVPKVIDFGIAKATQQTPTEKTLFTTWQQFIGTPAYMSPEQAELAGQDIDTRSDIYSLGVLLYELLTGRTPYETGHLGRANFDEMRRLILEGEPVRPSTRLKTLGAAHLAAAAARQGTEGPRLINLIRGDLDWIVMKCLEKDRSRRYETATGLARDIQRHLDDQPVSAAAPGTIYRLGKLVRRHRAGLATALALFILLVAGTVISAWQAVRATRAEKEQTLLRHQAEAALNDAKAQRKFAEDRQKDADEQRDRAQTALKTAESERGAKEIALTVATNSLVEAQRQQARAVDALERANQAGAATEAALADSKRQRLQLEENLRFLLFDVSDKLRPIGRVDLLRSVTEKVLSYYQSLPQEAETPDSQARRFAAFKNLGDVLALCGDSRRALEAYSTAMEVATNLVERDGSHGDWATNLCICHEGIGQAYEAQGDSFEALDHFQKSLEIARQKAAEAPWDGRWQYHMVASHLKCGDVFRAQPDMIKAAAEYKAALDASLRMTRLDPKNPDWQRFLSISYGKAGSLLAEQGDGEKAVDSCQKGLDLSQRLAVKDPGNTRSQSDLALSQDNLGDAWLAHKEPKRSIEHYQEALRIRRTLAQTDPDNTEWQRDLVRSYVRFGRALSAESDGSKRVQTLWEGMKDLGDLPVKHAILMKQLLLANDSTSKPIGGFRLNLKLAEQLAEKDPLNFQSQSDLAECHSLLGDMLLRDGKNSNALEEYKAAFELYRQLTEAEPQNTYLQYRLVVVRMKIASALRRLSRQDAARVEMQNTLDALVSLASRWPGNFIFIEGTRSGDGINPGLYPDQRADARAVFMQEFTTARAQAARQPPDPKSQEEWARRCLEMSTYCIWEGETAEALKHAENGLDTLDKLARSDTAASADPKELSLHLVMLGALQLLNRQPEAAIHSAQRGLKLDADSMACKAILTLGYVLNDQIQNARAVFRECKSMNAGQNNTFGEAVLGDLRLLSQKGLAPSDAERSLQQP